MRLRATSSVAKVSPSLGYKYLGWVCEVEREIQCSPNLLALLDTLCKPPPPRVSYSAFLGTYGPCLEAEFQTARRACCDATGVSFIEVVQEGSASQVKAQAETVPAGSEGNNVHLGPACVSTQAALLCRGQPSKRADPCPPIRPSRIRRRRNSRPVSLHAERVCAEERMRHL